jgi:hypothetical protein
MDYEYPKEKSAPIDIASVRVLSTMQRTLDDIMSRLSRIEEQLEQKDQE